MESAPHGDHHGPASSFEPRWVGPGPSAHRRVVRPKAESWSPAGCRILPFAEPRAWLRDKYSTTWGMVVEVTSPEKRGLRLLRWPRGTRRPQRPPPGHPEVDRHVTHQEAHDAPSPNFRAARVYNGSGVSQSAELIRLGLLWCGRGGGQGWYAARPRGHPTEAERARRPGIPLPAVAGRRPGHLRRCCPAPLQCE